MDHDVDGEGEMTKIDVRVPKALLESIDEKYEARGYASRSEAIRDALRDWVNPPATLSEETLGQIRSNELSRNLLSNTRQTKSPDEVREQLDLDD